MYEVDLELGMAECLSELAPTELGGSRIEYFRLGRALEERRGAGTVTLVALASGEPMSVGTASVLFARKFLRGCLLAAHVEDVAVRPDWQGRGVGRLLVERCVALARERGAYKVVLDCGEQTESFYGKLGFTRQGSYMRVEL